ncbi:hypothetical protein HAX54_004518 [Datura stramonium]|uniref:Uncharacterized protein n=1 Tax=Datura stramonium TaxID=4076 RepID=A0ABS8RVF8_DATST|nr:hypothetical protein [Datura stramonium]
MAVGGVRRRLECRTKVFVSPPPDFLADDCTERNEGESSLALLHPLAISRNRKKEVQMHPPVNQRALQASAEARSKFEELPDPDVARHKIKRSMPELLAWSRSSFQKFLLGVGREDDTTRNNIAAMQPVDSDKTRPEASSRLI